MFHLKICYSVDNVSLSMLFFAQLYMRPYIIQYELYVRAIYASLSSGMVGYINICYKKNMFWWDCFS